MIVKKTEEALDACLGALGRSGSVLLVPTETVYGLVCAWHDTAACARIYQLKHRSENKPFAAFLPSVEAVFSCIPQLPDAARIFAGTFCPGPITLVVPDGDVIQSVIDIVGRKLGIQPVRFELPENMAVFCGVFRCFGFSAGFLLRFVYIEKDLDLSLTVRATTETSGKVICECARKAFLS